MTRDRIPADTIAKLESTWTSVSQLGAGLTEDEWKSPTELPGWTVQDNLAHLIGTERMLEGLDAADSDAPRAAHVKNPIGEFNEREVSVRRTSSGAEVLAEWDDLVVRRLATLRDADDAYYDREVATPTGPGTVADFLHIRVLDCWSHEQDMRRAVGAPGNLGGPAAEHTIDRLIRTLPIVVGKRAGAPDGAAVAIELTGPVQRRLVVEVHDGRAALGDGSSATPVTTITMDSETFTVLSLGRRSFADLADRVHIAGDVALGTRVAEQLTMMI